MKLNKFFAGTALSALLLLTACDKNNDEENVNAQDTNFVMQASMSNRAEIELGNLALTRAANDSVKYFAQLMITEHTNAQTDLRDVVDDLDINIDLEQPLTADMMAARNMLAALNGRAFDSVYMRSQVMSHQMTIANFQTELNAGGSDRVKAYANEYLPHVQMHYNMAVRLHARVR